MNDEETGTDADGSEKSFLKRAFEAFVSIAILTGVTVILGYGGGFLLTIVAALGGPDPKTEDGDLLRERLLEWPDRNREFMRNNGSGELPWTP